jgi:hypothetical protein
MESRLTAAVVQVPASPQCCRCGECSKHQQGSLQTAIAASVGGRALLFGPAVGT